MYREILRGNVLENDILEDRELDGRMKFGGEILELALLMVGVEHSD